jgi:hypothetical protein
MSWRRYLFRVPRQNFFGAENAVVGNVGVALIASRLVDAVDLVARCPRCLRWAGSSDTDEGRDTDTDGVTLDLACSGCWR